MVTEDVLRIERQCFPNSAYKRKFFEKACTESGIGIFIAEHLRDREVCGYICMRLEGNTLYVISLAVDALYRREKIGFKLMKYAEFLHFSRFKTNQVSVATCSRIVFANILFYCIIDTTAR